MLDLDRNLGLDSSGDLVTINGLQALGQRLENRLSTQQGQWPYALSHGVPWLVQVLGEAGDSGAIRQLLSQQIAADAEVASIGEFAVRFDARTRRLQYSIPVRVVQGDDVTINV